MGHCRFFFFFNSRSLWPKNVMRTPSPPWMGYPGLYPPLSLSCVPLSFAYRPKKGRNYVPKRVHSNASMSAPSAMEYDWAVPERFKQGILPLPGVPQVSDALAEVIHQNPLTFSFKPPSSPGGLIASPSGAPITFETGRPRETHFGYKTRTAIAWSHLMPKLIHPYMDWAQASCNGRSHVPFPSPTTACCSAPLSKTRMVRVVSIFCGSYYNTIISSY